jgi:hypothetical protein
MEAILTHSQQDKPVAGKTYNVNLALLEDKVVKLVDLVKSLREKNVELTRERELLVDQLRLLEGSLVSETRDLEELSQEKVMTKMVVEDLINNIDALIEQAE